MFILKNVYFMLLKIKMNNTIDTCIHCERFVRRRPALDSGLTVLLLPLRTFQLPLSQLIC